MVLLKICTFQNNKNNSVSVDTDEEWYWVEDRNQDSPNDHVSRPSGRVRNSEGYTGNLRCSTAAKDGAAVKPAGMGMGM